MKTVSDSKRAFYSAYSRPISSVYRRVVEELLVEMHLLSVNADFKPDALYYLGVVTTFERLMQGYEPKSDREQIFNALCNATDADPQNFKAQASALPALVAGKSAAELVTWLGEPNAPEDQNYLVEPIRAIAANENFKYSRAFAIGIYTLLENCDAEAVKETEKRERIADEIATTLQISGEKMKKDFEVYRGSLEKMEQVLKVIEDVLEASRKKREKRAQEQKNQESPASEQPAIEEATAE